MKILKFLFFFFGITSAIAQTQVGEITEKFEVVKQSFNVIDEATGNFAVFVEDRNYIYGKLYNSDYKVLGWINSVGLSSRFKSIIGYKINGSAYTLLMSTADEKKYGIVSFDFEKRLGSSRELDFTLKGEKLLDIINHNNSTYLLTVPKRSSQINFYQFEDFDNPQLTEVKFEENTFLDRKDRPTDFSHITDKTFLSQLSVENPNSMEMASRQLKLYKDGSNITITSDKYGEFTYVIHIDINTFQKSVQRIDKPTIEGFRMALETNSFYKDNKLFQLIANSDILKFQVVDLASEEILQNFTLQDEEPLFFKNTPIVLQGGDFNSYRELHRTNQFLRKLSSGDIGISVYKPNDVYQITFGATEQKLNMGVFLPTYMVGGLIGVMIISAIDPLTTSYSLYKNSKSTKLTGLFNENFEHMEGEVEKNVFDIISEKLEEEKRITATTLFQVKDAYLYGYYDKEDGLFKIFEL